MSRSMFYNRDWVRAVVFTSFMPELDTLKMVLRLETDNC